MISTFALVVIVVVVALVFDFVNGFHDAANAIATIIVSKTLTPLQAVVLAGTAHFGIPVSTTHVISGSIMGVGAVEHAAKVRWITARKIIWAWILTIPTSALFAGLSYLVFGPFFLSHTR